nr:DJ-1/PfpI family protein [uncultured Flavobacterium sp.]
MDTQEDIVVGFALYQGCTLMDFAGATQVFSSSDGFKSVWLALDQTIITTEGVAIEPNFLFSKAPKIDILFVPGGGPNGVVSTMQNKEYLNHIRKISEKTLWKGSVCTGAFVLAAAGILKNCLATTYWSQIPTLGLLADKLKLKIPPSYPRFSIDMERKIFTGGGISSSLDLALEMVLIIKGLEAAQTTQLFIQYQPNPPVDAGDPDHAPQYITDRMRKEDEGFSKALTQQIEKIIN